MLGSSKLVAFLATADAKKARHFYETVIGLSFVADETFALVFDANGVMIRIFKVDGLSPQPYTALGWDVADIEAAMHALRGKGVTFDRFPYLEQDASDVWISPSGAKVAWFKDPDGNTLSVTQFVR